MEKKAKNSSVLSLLSPPACLFSSLSLLGLSLVDHLAELFIVQLVISTGVKLGKPFLYLGRQHTGLGRILQSYKYEALDTLHSSTISLTDLSLYKIMSVKRGLMHNARNFDYIYDLFSSSAVVLLSSEKKLTALVLF